MKLEKFKEWLGRVVNLLHKLGGLSKDESEEIKKLDPACPKQRGVLIVKLKMLVNWIKSMVGTKDNRRFYSNNLVARFSRFFTTERDVGIEGKDGKEEKKIVRGSLISLIRWLENYKH